MVQRSGVLIETYWNVNTGGKGSRCGTAVGINRNILECKLVSKDIAIPALFVLIETYWNVNVVYVNVLDPAKQY